MADFFSNFEHFVSDFLQNTSHGLPLPVVILLAFGGGVAASLTPCVLPIIPLYLTYIGATEVTSKFDALKRHPRHWLPRQIIKIADHDKSLSQTPNAAFLSNHAEQNPGVFEKAFDRPRRNPAGCFETGCGYRPAVLYGVRQSEAAPTGPFN